MRSLGYIFKVNKQSNQKNSLTKKLNRLSTIITVIAAAFILTGSVSLLSGQPKANAYATPGNIYITSPAQYSYIPNNLTLVAGLGNETVNDYDMFWYVDNGSWNWMSNSPNGQNTKQASINVSGWTWHAPSNQYTITVVAVMHYTNQRIYSGVQFYVGTAPATTTTPTATTTSTTTPTTTTSSMPATSGLPSNLYVNPNSNAAQTANSTTDTTMKRVMTKLAAVPTAAWFGDWNSNVQTDVNNLVSAAANTDQVPVLVAYNIPERDCGSYSSGGATSAVAYQTWIQNFANGIGNRQAIVVLEPDALAQITCLSSTDQTTRYQLLNSAITTLKTNANTLVYVDAGNPSWVGAQDMANRLNTAGVSKADGFSLNVSNFIATSDNVNYGHSVSAAIGNKHFIVDTGRNGNGSNGQWCNPSGRAVGTPSTHSTNDNLVDYYLWVKTPGESDGTCNGGPAAGTWWPSYAETLALDAGW